MNYILLTRLGQSQVHALPELTHQIHLRKLDHSKSYGYSIHRNPIRAQ
jgi:hypothetical protein